MVLRIFLLDIEVRGREVKGKTVVFGVLKRGNFIFELLKISLLNTYCLL